MPARSGWFAGPVTGTAGVALAAVGLYVVTVSQWEPPHPGFQLLAIPVGVFLLLVRHRFPGAVLLALGLLTGAAPVVGPVLAAASYTLAGRMSEARGRIRSLGGTALLAVVAATVCGPRLGTGSALYGLAMGLVMAVTAVAVPGLAGTVYGQQGRLLRALRERGDAAERARRSADSEARTQERSRIAAEMHDLVGHRLSLISLHAGGLELALDKAAPELREEAVLVRRTTRDAMRELRQALGVLGPLSRDTGPDTLTDATGTRADIEALVAESRDGGIAVGLEWSGADLVDRPASVRRAVHRVVREALTNVHRYARTAPVTVTVVQDDTVVRVVVRNGVPSGRAGTSAVAAAVGTGRGLTGLRERVELLGGYFEAATPPSGGFEVAAVVPVAPGEGGGQRLTAASAGTLPAATGPQPVTAGVAHAPPARRTAGAWATALGALALWLLMTLGIALVYAARPAQTPPPSVPRLGMTYEELHGVTDNRAVRAAATGHEPPRPAGAAGCVYPATGTEPRPGALVITRYCFDSGQHLVAIDRFTVPSVRDTSPWETP
ncbi:sensor histidine kinase [Streptomyces sp. cg36]|uniref:sensor histidine kinase n=1 Tax=Streptomyces sp. cg36 TaxID=3238798 RepID=UPI0034E2FE07